MQTGTVPVAVRLNAEPVQRTVPPGLGRLSVKVTDPAGIAPPLVDEVTTAVKLTDWSTEEAVGDELRLTVVVEEFTR